MSKSYNDIFDMLRKTALPIAAKYSDIPELSVLMKTVPYFGEIVDGYLNSLSVLYTKRAIEKLAIMLYELKNELEKEPQENIDRTFFSSGDFQDLFFLVNAKIQRGIRNYKLLFLARLLKQGSKKENPLGTDKTEEYIEIIDSLSRDDMFILYLLQEFLKDKSLKYNFGDETIYRFAVSSDRVPGSLKSKYDQSDVLTYLYRLSRFGLLVEITGVWRGATDPNHTYFRATKYFEEFLNYIEGLDVEKISMV